jgi:hypothetical protein
VPIGAMMKHGLGLDVVGFVLIVLVVSAIGWIL